MMKMMKPRSMALGLVLALAASACGSGESSFAELTADADGAGVSTSFCDALEDASEFLDGADGQEDGLASFQPYLAEIRRTLPSDAPADVGDVLEATEGLIEAAVALDAADAPDQEQIDEYTAVINDLNDRDQAQVTAYLNTTCPGYDDADTGLFASDATPANPEAPQPTEAAADPAPAQPDVDADVETVPVVETIVTSAGGTGNYDQVEITIRDARSTNAALASTFTNEPVAGDAPLLLVAVEFEATTSQGRTFRANNFRLIGPAGRAVTAQELVDQNGESDTIDLDGRDTDWGTLVFDTNEFDAGTTEWTLAVQDDNKVPALIPFTPGSLDRYPITIESGQTQTIIGSNTFADCFDQYDVEVRSAAVTLDFFGNANVRADRGSRFVSINLSLTNTTPADQNGTVGGLDQCLVGSGALFNQQIRLLADDRPIGWESSANGIDTLDAGASQDYLLVFEIKADDTEFELVGAVEAETIASWTMELPLVDGD